MSTSPSFITPLRYPGGKARLGAWLAELIRHNGLETGCYIEPYAGGAGAAVFLLANKHVDRIIINDADPVIYAFWWALLNDHERLIDMINATPATMETWYAQRSIVDEGLLDDITKLGFATFFLNRTNRSGIIKGGVVGGKEQSGKYKLDARYKTESLVARINRLAELKNKITLFNMDAMEFLALDECQINGEGLIYLDPPYYKKGSQLYRNHYNPEDHAAIADQVMALNTPWLVTYDNCDEIKKLYSQAQGVEFSLHYSTHLSRPKTVEALFYNNIELHSAPTLKR